jgi:hypothetical protein
MDLMLKLEAKPAGEQIHHQQGIFLTGSCFTEHIGKSLQETKFKTFQNPHGILFDTLSVCRSLVACIEKKQYQPSDLFELNEAWHSWQHHSFFSHPDAGQALGLMNQYIREAHAFLQTADWIIITLGSSFSYQLTPEAAVPQKGWVANCHKGPAAWFQKKLISIEEQVSALDQVMHRLRMMNPSLKIIFTVSPVRHIRDGVVENNRSKARLLETVHHLVNKFEQIYYFPAYELVIDVLRDYRFYDIDMVHPNYQATGFVFEHFLHSFINASSRELAEELRPLSVARRHKPFNAQSLAHKKFMLSHFEKARALQQRYPWLDMSAELAYFGSTGV